MGKTELIISAVGLIGIGGLIKSIFDSYVESKKKKDQARQEFKEIRYKAILLLCHAMIDYENSKGKLVSHRPDIQSKELLRDELRVEWFNMALYASDKVILAMKKFIENSSSDNFTEVIFAMRKSLYNIKTSLNVNELKLGE